METRWPIVAISLCALCLSVQVSAQDPHPVTGDWRQSTSSAQAAHRGEAISEATEDLNVLVRGRARSHLRETTAPAGRLRISVNGQTLSIRAGERNIEVQLGGPAVRVDDGRVSATRGNGNAIVVTAHGENGRRVSTYRVSDDGQRLAISVRITGERLSSPIRYRLTYQRQ